MCNQWLSMTFRPAYEALASAFLRNANDRRFTRTVLALRQFRVQQGRWPESLAELSRIGLPQSATQAFDGGPFAYEVDQQDQAILFNTADKTKTEVFDNVETESITLRP